MSDDCDHPEVHLIVTTVTDLTNVDQDQGCFLITPMDLDEPDAIQVELACPDCGHQAVLRHDQWEVI